MYKFLGFFFCIGLALVSFMPVFSLPTFYYFMYSSFKFFSFVGWSIVISFLFLKLMFFLSSAILFFFIYSSKLSCDQKITPVFCSKRGYMCFIENSNCTLLLTYSKDTSHKKYTMVGNSLILVVH